MTVVDVDGTEPPEHFGFGDRLEIIAAESRRMTEVVAALDLETRVPTTPEWSVRDLAHHIGVEQWYWGQNVRAQDAQHRSAAELTPVPEDSDLLAWLGWCTYSLSAPCARSAPTRRAGPGGPNPTRRAPWAGTRPRRCPCTAGTPRA